IPRHHHLGALGQLHRPGHIGGAEVKLRPVVVKERRMSAALLFTEHVHLALELRMRGDRAGLGQHLAALHFLAFGPAQQYPDVVPSSESSPSRALSALPITIGVLSPGKSYFESNSLTSTSTSSSSSLSSTMSALFRYTTM